MDRRERAALVDRTRSSTRLVCTMATITTTVATENVTHETRRGELDCGS